MKRRIFSKVLMDTIHSKCRRTDVPYLKSDKFRIPVPDDKVKWSVYWKDYNPLDYTDPHIKGKEWADKEINEQLFKFNELDGNINRKSHFGTYELDKDGRPQNPQGRTGIRGRGILGRWGPNHAADPVVTRIRDGKLEFVAIQRGDTGEWAIPGGMVDAGETVSATLKREFTEEALGDVSQENLQDLWEKGDELYKGYVDDPRNTDNAWMETVAMNFHDSTGLLANTKFEAGSDATNVCWIPVDTEKPLYASHTFIINLLKEKSL